MLRRSPRPLAFALAVVGLALCADQLAAQIVTGRAFQSDSVTPAARVMVELRVDGSGPQRVLTDAAGQFRARMPSAGLVSARVLRPGLRPTVVAPFAIRDGETREIRFVLGTERVTLAPVSVTSDRVCGERADASAWRLWEEARTVLQSTVLTERDIALQVRVVEFEGRPTGQDGVEVVDSTLRIVPLGEVFGREHYDSLFRFGFIRRNTPGVTTYYAPNPVHLADERFVATHCFRLAVTDTLADDLVGVQFEPLNRPRYTDIIGTLWLDVETYQLRRIEFGYVNPPFRHRTVGTGGSLEFERLVTGHWINRAWTIRMASPLSGVVFAPERSLADPLSGLASARSDFGLWVRRQLVFQVTEGETLLFRDAAADSLARRAR